MWVFWSVWRDVRVEVWVWERVVWEVWRVWRRLVRVVISVDCEGGGVGVRGKDR